MWRRYPLGWVSKQQRRSSLRRDRARMSPPLKVHEPDTRDRHHHHHHHHTPPHTTSHPTPRLTRHAPHYRPHTHKPHTHDTTPHHTKQHHRRRHQPPTTNHHHLLLLLHSPFPPPSLLFTHPPTPTRTPDKFCYDLLFVSKHRSPSSRTLNLYSPAWHRAEWQQRRRARRGLRGHESHTAERLSESAQLLNRYHGSPAPIMEQPFGQRIEQEKARAWKCVLCGCGNNLQDMVEAPKHDVRQLSAVVVQSCRRSRSWWCCRGGRG